MTGVREREGGPLLGFGNPTVPVPSPSFTRVSMDFSKFPLCPLRTDAFLFSSAKPISRSWANFVSRSSGSPSTFEALFLLSGEGGRGGCSYSLCAAAAWRRAFDDRGKIDEADLKPNLCPGFGGRGGGWSSEFVLPVLCLTGGFAALSWYFCLMNLSIAESVSSASKRTGGRWFWAL